MSIFDDRPRSPKRKRSEYEYGDIDSSPVSKPRIMEEDPATYDEDANGYAYEDPLDSTPPAEATPVTPPPPQRPTTLSYTAHLTFHGHNRPLSAVKISPSGTLLASASADATIKIWSLTSCTLLQVLEAHLAGVSCIAWSPDSRVLASGSDDKCIRLWDVQTGRCHPTALVGHSNYVYSLAFSPKGNMLASGSYDEAVFLWDVRTARVMRSLPAHSDPVSGVDFVADGTLVASCSSDGLIRIWDSGTGQCLKTLVHEDHKPVGAVKFSPNGKFVAAATLDDTVRLWRYVEGRVVKTYLGGKNERYSCAVCFGRYWAEEGGEEWAFIAAGGEDGTVTLWDVNSKDALGKIEAHDGAVLGVDVSGDSKTIVTCGLDGKVKVWRRQDQKEDVVVNGVGMEANGEEVKQEGEATPPIVANGHD